MKCSSIETLPDGLSSCKKLAHLNLRSCVKLQSLPEGLEELPRLRTLDIATCDGLKTVPTWLVGDSWRMDALDFSDKVRKQKDAV